MNKKTIPFLIAPLLLFTQEASFAQNSGSIFDKLTQQGKTNSSNSTSSQQSAAPSSSASSILSGQSSPSPAAAPPSPPMQISPFTGTSGQASSFTSSPYGQNSNAFPNGMTELGKKALERYGNRFQIPGSGSAGQHVYGTNGGAPNSYPTQKVYPGVPGHYAPMNAHGSLMDWALPQGYRPGTAAREAEAKQAPGQIKHPWGWYPREMDCANCGTHHSLNEGCPICGFGSNVPCKHSWYHED